MTISVTISMEALKGAGSCGDHLRSPEWTGSALEYTNLDATMLRLAKTSCGRGRLRWLAEKKLIPRTVDQVLEFLEEHPCEVFERPHRDKPRQPAHKLGPRTEVEPKEDESEPEQDELEEADTELATREPPTHEPGDTTPTP